MSEYLLSLPLSWSHIHPVLVHFTTALLPVSLVSDVLGKFHDRSSLTPAAWWMLLYAALATPATAIAGWMWAGDVAGMTGSESTGTMATHQWLGIILTVCFLVLAFWRGHAFRRRQKPSPSYIAFAVVTVAALLYQGYLGGKMTLG
jgi:uncharacterized membrane protein